MNGLNKAYLIGNLGADPEIRAAASGLAVTRVSLATPGRRKVGEGWVDEPDWHRVTFFGRDAEYVARYAKKGATLAVECAVRPHRWTDKEGKTRFEVNLVAERVLWMNNRGAVEAPAEPPAGPAADPESDAIPF